ncbi:MAG: hypothetical protein WDN50_01970 [Bradyrhizobium sp.]
MVKSRKKDWQMAREPFAERVLGQVEQAIPDLRACISAVTIETPQDIERENPEFRGRGLRLGKPPSPPKLFLPADGWLVELQTPIDSLFMIGASTWPGGGVNGASGVHGCAKAAAGREDARCGGRRRLALDFPATAIFDLPIHSLKLAIDQVLKFWNVTRDRRIGHAR